MKSKIEVEHERSFKPYPELSRANRVILENTKQQRDGWYYECLCSILISAFRFEGLLNQLGYQTISFWDKIERISWHKKLGIICNSFDISINTGARPFQTILELFSFRDNVVHSKPQFLNEKQIVKSESIESARRNWPKTRWEKMCCIEFAERCYGDVMHAARILGKGAEVDWDDFLTTGSSYVAGPFENEADLKNLFINQSSEAID